MKEWTPFFVLLTLAFPLVHSHSESFNNFQFDTCSIEKKFCRIDEENLIEIIIEITDLEECRERCGDVENCQYFSHFGANSFPFSDYCALFSSCSLLEDCGEDCYTEDKLCNGSCGRSFQSIKDGNVIEFVPDVELERNCKGICLEDPDCLYYTYYGRENDRNPHLCVLLSDLSSHSQECENCVTSLPNCKNTSYISCQFTIDNNQTLHDSHVFTNVDVSVNVTFSPSASLGCRATMIAIGGGGDGDNYGGGGSGYVESNVIDIFSMEYEVSVGDWRQDSFVRENNGQNIIIAQPGGHGGTGSPSNGGFGYSGGGSGGTGYKGGSNGSDGEGANGGSGSGFDISTISLEYHILSPGNGGDPYGNYGGRGGGVLVDNIGPTCLDYPWLDCLENGYGGGGGAGNNGYTNFGLQGMVLIETKAKTST